MYARNHRIDQVSHILAQLRETEWPPVQDLAPGRTYAPTFVERFKFDYLFDKLTVQLGAEPAQALLFALAVQQM